MKYSANDIRIDEKGELFYEFFLKGGIIVNLKYV